MPEASRYFAAIALALIWLAMLLLGTGPADQQLLGDLYAGGEPALVTTARFFTLLGQPVVVIGLSLLVGLVLFSRHDARHALIILGVTLLGRGVAELQKYAILRPRPILFPHLVREYTPSFPSGHATSSMIVYLTLALVIWERSRWRMAAVAAAVLLSLCIGGSRLLLGVHWPSDVVAGWSFGAAWVLVTLPLAQRLVRR